MSPAGRGQRPRIQKMHPAKEIVSQICSNERKPSALQKEQHHAANRDDQRQAEEQTAIVHYDDAEDREMTEDRAGHHAESEASTQPSRPRNQDQNRRDQFGDAGADASPRLKSDFCEDVN